MTAARRWRWHTDASGWLDAAAPRPSPHHDQRPTGGAIDLIVVHAISLPPGRFSGDAIERLFLGTLDCSAHPYFDTLRGLRVSSHFLVRRGGRLLQFVGIHDRAWHAGVSSFLGRERCNDFSIGIELEGDDARPFTSSQYRVLARLVGALRQVLPITCIAGHADIAPGRKTDPGPAFEWPRLLAMDGVAGLERPQQQGASGRGPSLRG